MFLGPLKEQLHIITDPPSYLPDKGWEPWILAVLELEAEIIIIYKAQHGTKIHSTELSN